jgi:primase-polymerase (primpol)-like protein
MDQTLPTGVDLPHELTERAQWVCWREQERDGRPTKVPVDPNTGGFASATDPETWGTFDEARAYAEANGIGVGFVFTEADPFVGVDLDKCRVPATGTVADWAGDIVDQLDSYTEVSPSGTGYHVIVEGGLPDGGNRRGDVEMYAHSRYFTVTGEHVEGTPRDVRIRDEALEAVHREFVLGETEAENEGAPTERESVASATPDLSDAEVLERARSARNGAKFDRLYRGSTAGYDSNSEADMALCAMLSFWTGGDEGQVDRLFRDSGLYREKWDAVHFADGATYGEKTVERAIAGTEEFYTPVLTDEGSWLHRERPAVSRPTGRASTVGRNAEEWHATVERLNEVLTELEDENAALRSELEAERARRRILEAQLEDSSGKPSTLWQRLRGRQRSVETDAPRSED